MTDDAIAHDWPAGRPRIQGTAMTPAQVAHIMVLVEEYAVLREHGSAAQYDAAGRAVEAALLAPQQAEPPLSCNKVPPGNGYCDQCAKGMYEQCRYTTPSAPTAVEPDERTPQDYAIEHAEYMAQSAAHLIACVNDLALAEQQCEDGEANPSDVDAARESVTEAQGHLKSSIYEFRKRRDRASKGTK